MNKDLKHVVIIPARKNSKGLKNKNRMLFENTAEFVKKISFFNQDYQNIQIYICEFIVNKQTDLLLEVLMHLLKFINY